MVARNEIYWASLAGPYGRRPVCVLTRDAAIGVLDTVICAVITTQMRGIGSEVEVGIDEGLGEPSVISCDNILALPKAVLDPQPVGSLAIPKRIALDRALRYALDIVY